MYDIKQFRPVLYLVVLIGITGYAMASESAGIWIFGTALVLTNAYLIHKKQFQPIPRLLANAITVLCAIYMLTEFRGPNASPILAIGQFLVLLQIVKVWEQRANRDYAQLLVLSLLLMVAAAISTGSLVFGLMFVGYLFLSLYCCLLFHLKVETDQAKAALAPVDMRWSDSTLKRDQQFLSRSMRRLTGLVAFFALTSAVIVFLLFPRGTGANMFGQLQWRPKNSLTGFSEQVSFREVARITQNDTVVGDVKIFRGDQPEQFHGTLLLRGVTHDYYAGPGDADHAAYQWGRAPSLENDARHGHWEEMLEDNGTWTAKYLSRNAKAAAVYREEIQLTPTGTPTLFSIAGATTFKPADTGLFRRLLLLYSPSDQTIRSSEALQMPVRYSVMASDRLGNEAPLAPIQSRIDPQITAFFSRYPQVLGDLVQRRAAEVAARPDKGMFYVSPLDDQIAQRIEHYLQHNYAYTLDLTGIDQVSGRDPMVAFLYDFKKGHCEYFAGAMTLLCQSLGINARLVVGFKVDDFNPFGQFYTIRQSQAHAWVEVLTSSGWKSFDPTSGSEAAGANASMWQKTKHLFDFLQYNWQNSVISYNADNRDNLIQTVDNRLSQAAGRSGNNLGAFRESLNKIGDWLATEVVGPLVALLVLTILGALAWFAFERWKLRRRAKRIGIKDMPPSDQAKLIRQLGFYEDLLMLLEKHDIARPPHLTPLEFSASLAFLPPQIYETVRRLTQLYYKIRYGGSELDDAQQRRLRNVIDRLSTTMATPQV